MREIYDYEDPKSFLKDVFEVKKRRNSQFSLRAWSKNLGFASPNMLSMILRGERRVQPKMARKIGETLKLKEEHIRYFEILALFSKAKSTEEKNVYYETLKKLRPAKAYKQYSKEQHDIMTIWYNMAIYELVKLKDFQDDPKWISNKLGGLVSTKQVQESIERLIKHNFITKLNGNLVNRSLDNFSTYDDIPDSKIKNHHEQSFERAKDALHEQSVDEREFASITLAIDSAKMEEAKTLLRDFQEKFDTIMSVSETKDEVYQLNMQFFSLTKDSQSEKTH